MTIQECYVALGGSYEQVARRLPSAGMVERFLARFPGDDSFAKLCAGMECGRREEAFRAAHTLKGVCANLGLDRLMDSAGRLTELLRPEQDAIPEGADALLREVRQDYEITVVAIETYLNSRS